MANVNKAGISPVPIEKYSITTGDVINYLTNKVLGFKIGYDFTRWTGVTPEKSYVRMRVVMNPNDIVAVTKDNDYASRVLNENAAGVLFKEDVINALDPFAFPKSIINLRNTNPADIQRMYEHGLTSNRIDEIINYSQLTYQKDSNLYGIYLRPERIIADMLADPTTGKIDGNWTISGVEGTTSETIRWDVIVSHASNFNDGSNINIDSIFSRK